jgi:small GTP-binding protein
MRPQCVSCPLSGYSPFHPVKTRHSQERVFVNTKNVVSSGSPGMLGQKKIHRGGNPSRVVCQSSLLPAGKKQSRVEIPGIILEVESSIVMERGGAVEDVVKDGYVTGVIVKETPGAGAGELYAAVVALQDAVGSSVSVLVEDRSDVAEAAGASGVMVSATGLPIVVAKGRLGQGALVGKVATGGKDATQAAFEGAGLVVMDVEESCDTMMESILAELVEEARKQVSASSIPVMGRIVDGKVMERLFSGNADVGQTQRLLSNMDGVVMNFIEYEAWKQDKDGFGNVVKSYLTSAGLPASSPPSDATEEIAQVSDVLSASRENVIARQKDFLTGLIGFIEESCPLLDEVSLLRDSVKQLDELFLVVIVGEFNSGKSAVVNALLGNNIVPEGILPTTNEITVIKYADVEHGEEERVEQDGDGLFVRYTGAELLKEINIVDTPGTNVILERQQRLTEEFIPRADLVLFVLSADRPFTDSEVKFLQYVRQWGKKVVFVVNKVDLLSNNDEIQEVVEFVENNAKRLLGVEGAKAIPVSAKRATQAKIECRYALGDTGAGILTPGEREYLSTSQQWKSSRFESLESHVRDFLLGSTADSGTSQSLKLKLQTPLFVAEALMDASKTQLESELAVLKRDEESVKMVSKQLKMFRDEMSKEAKVQKAEIIQQSDRMTDMISGVIDDVMQISNWKALIPYLDKNASNTTAAAGVLYKQDISKDALKRINSVIDEHREWLRVNCGRVEENYKQFVQDRMAVYDITLEEPPRHASAGESFQAHVDMKEISDIVEAEVQVAVTSSVNTAASATGLGLVLTTVLPSTLEDLLAVGLSAAIGYTSLLNIPVRRMEAKKKVKTLISALVQSIHDAMDTEREQAIQRCEASVTSMMDPLDRSITAEITRLEGNLNIMETRYTRGLEEIRKEI